MNAPRTSSPRYCSAETALKVQSLERVFTTWRNFCRDSPGCCLRVASRWRANTSFFALTYTFFNSVTAASYVLQSSMYWYTEGVRKLISPRQFTRTFGSAAACPISTACKKDSNVAIQYLKTEAALESVGNTSKSFGRNNLSIFSELHCRALAFKSQHALFTENQALIH